MSLWKLRLSMVTALTILIGFTTSVITVILSLLGVFNIYLIIGLAIVLNLIQWLISPYIVESIYRVKEADPNKYSFLHRIIERLSMKSGLKKPRVMIAEVEIPNAFAYGSPLSGSRVAVTRGLLNILEEDEIEAVLGHELGHIKHKDMQIMMFISILPAIFYYLGYTLYFSSLYSSRRDEGGGLFIVGLLSLFAYYILSLIVLWFSRLREYYADSHSMEIVEGGGPKLATALAKIISYTSTLKGRGFDTSKYSGFKTLFIADPDRSPKESEELRVNGLIDEAVYKIAKRKISIGEKILELLSTHPNTTKRIRRLLGIN